MLELIKDILLWIFVLDALRALFLKGILLVHNFNGNVLLVHLLFNINFLKDVQGQGSLSLEE